MTARPSARALAARRTRTRIVQAAASLFDEQGYGATTLRSIAERAGVSVETVGLAGPKRRLLRDAFDMAFAGDAAAFPAAGEPAYVALSEMLGFEDAVAEYLRMLGASIARTAGLWAAFQAAADADAEAAALFAEVRSMRRREFRRTAQWLADRGVVAQEQVPALVDEWFLVASHETFLLLRSECGWTLEQFVARMQTQVSRMLADAAG